MKLPKQAIRLGQHELRLLVRALNANGKPILGAWYGATRSLVELGLVRKVPLRVAAERSQLRDESWKRIKASAVSRNLNECNAAVRLLFELVRNESGVILTKRGEDLARGVSIRKG